MPNSHFPEIAVQMVHLLLCHRMSSNWTKQPFPAALGYNFYVARGWESKSVEEQQAQAVSDSGPARPPLTPAQIARQRRRQGLVLSRQHVLQQLEATQNPRHREILQSALADLDAQLAQLV
jgi:hypothetical protein